MLKLLVLFSLFCLSFLTFGQFTNESELGIVVTGGNTELQVYNGKVTNQYVLDKNTFTLGGHYMYGTSFDVENARNWDVNGKYNRALSKHAGTFVGFVYEGDEFAGIDNRLNVDLGGSYQIVKTEKTNIKSEAGYRYRREEDLTGNSVSQSQGRLYVTGKRTPTKDISFGMWVEYLPNFTTPSDWQVNFEPNFQYNFHSNLALKWGYMGRYDNLPVLGNKKFDFTYITSLIAKF
jgi:hypothetical protein